MLGAPLSGCSANGEAALARVLHPGLAANMCSFPIPVGDLDALTDEQRRFLRGVAVRIPNLLVGPGHAHRGDVGRHARRLLAGALPGGQAAKKEARRAWHLVDIRLPSALQAATAATFAFSLRRGRYWTGSPPCRWSMCICQPPTAATWCCPATLGRNRSGRSVLQKTGSRCVKAPVLFGGGDVRPLQHHCGRCGHVSADPGKMHARKAGWRPRPAWTRRLRRLRQHWRASPMIGSSVWACTGTQSVVLGQGASGLVARKSGKA